jgi:hypothetical protein
LKITSPSTTVTRTRVSSMVIFLESSTLRVRRSGGHA